MEIAKGVCPAAIPTPADDRIRARIAAAERRVHERAELRAALKVLRDHGLVTRHASKLARIG